MFTTIGVFGLVMSLSSPYIDVTTVMQLPELPTGCEAVSSVMLLNNYGFSIDKSDFTESYLTCDYYKSNEMYDKYFFGNPFSVYGSYCNPSVCCEAIEKYFYDVNEKELSPVDITGQSFDYILNLVSLNIPVAIWATIDYVEPQTYVNEVNVTAYRNSHCVVVSGFDLERGVVIIDDPLLGEIEKEISLIEDVYNKRGKRALCILRNN